ncbi:MAG: class I SAM-dependent methyltransferase [Anaerolineae bacterium]
MTEDYRDANRRLWNTWTALHQDSDFYNVAAVREGGSSLRSIEREELTDVAGKTLLHLQCHFGLDTLSWARQGAIVTGVDLADNSIALARALSAELDLPATFVCADILELPDALDGQFDIVFTSYGVLHWMRDLRRWAEVVAHFVKPGGIFYIVEDHPFMRACSRDEHDELKPDNSYFFTEEPWRFESRGSYAAPLGEDAPLNYGYNWDHSMGEIITVLAQAGLHIEFLHEFTFHFREKFKGMVRREANHWYLTRQDGMIPLLFSLQARKPPTPA